MRYEFKMKKSKLKKGKEMKHLSILTALILLIVNVVFTQIPEDRENLLKGEGSGQGKFAETNGYPGPKHVLDFADSLQLTDAQKKSVRDIYNEMKTRATELGERIIEAEEELNTAFVEGLITEKTVRENAEQIGRLRGRLRAVHLNAHLKTKGILTAKQIALYKKLRAGGKEHKH